MQRLALWTVWCTDRLSLCSAALVFSLVRSAFRGTISAADIVTDAIVHPELLDSWLPDAIKQARAEGLCAAECSLLVAWSLYPWQ